RGGLEGVGRAVVARAVAALGDVADIRGGARGRGALGGGRAGGARSRAALGEVADSGSRATLHRGALEGVGGTVVVRAVAALGDVADIGGGPANGGGLPLWRASGA